MRRGDADIVGARTRFLQIDKHARRMSPVQREYPLNEITPA